MRALVAAALALLVFAGDALGQVSDDSSMTPEVWVVSALQRSMIADFDKRCPKRSLPPAHEECRTLSPAFIERLAMQRVTEGDPSHSAVRITGALITGSVDLVDEKIARSLSIVDSRIEGDFLMDGAQFDYGLSLKDSKLTGKVSGSGTRISGDLRLEGVKADELNLIGATIGGFAQLNNLEVAKSIVLNNARIRYDLNAESITTNGGLKAAVLDVGGSLYMTNQKSSPDIYAPDATIGVDGWFCGKLGTIFLDSVHIRSSLHMECGTSFGDVTLSNAQIDRTWGATGSFKNLAAVGIHVGQTAYIRSMTVEQNVDFTEAQFGGDLNASGQKVGRRWIGKGMHVAGDLLADGISVGDQFVGSGLNVGGGLSIAKATIGSASAGSSALDLGSARIGDALDLSDSRFMQPATTAGVAVQPVSLRNVRVGANVNLRGATLRGLDLSGGAIGSEFLLGGGGVGKPVCWQRPSPTAAETPCQRDSDSRLILVNARIDTLMRGDLAAWPDHLELTGLTYTRLAADTSSDELEQWRLWLERDPDYRSQPYAQLAAVMAAEGDRENAASIQYYARERERLKALKAHEWGTFVALTALWGLAGYGIGNYTWVALAWVAGLTLIGAMFVYTVRDARGRGRLWPLGASLERLLPYVRLDPSFTSFFEKQEGFRWWHKFVFCLLALLGSALGLFLAAAASGLTQKG